MIRLQVFRCRFFHGVFVFGSTGGRGFTVEAQQSATFAKNDLCLRKKKHLNDRQSTIFFLIFICLNPNNIF